ncbi:MAG: hypothetical protein FJ319_07485 [SAR202 cluster bacterium]|nr:hypothetical protein [SAR202 cluster bacterium]
MSYLATSARRERVFWTTALAAVLVAVLVLTTRQAAAQAVEDPIEIFRETKGAYALSMTMLPNRPTVGIVHFNILPTAGDGVTPVTDAEILVVANNPQGKAEYQVRALNDPADRSRYAANMMIEHEGLWTFDVEIKSGSLGEEKFTAPLEIGELPIDPGWEGGLILALILIGFAGGITYLVLSSRKALREREASRHAAAQSRA